MLALGLAASLACTPEIQERCRLVTNPAPPPALPGGLAELDALLLRRAMDMTHASRGLNNSMVIVFHKDFAEQLLPALCLRLEQARALAIAGRTAEAGRKYQALLVSSQVLAFAVALQATAQYADDRKQAGGQVTQTLEKFAIEAAPIFRAALSEDPREISRALNAQPAVFASWARLSDDWPAQVDGAARQAEVAKVVWDITFLVVATYQAAGAAAEIVAAGRPPMPPLPAFATAGGAATSFSGPAALEMAETLRKLIALGVLDAGVVAALSRPLGGRAAPPPPTIPNAAQMSGASSGPAKDATGAAGGERAGKPFTRAGKAEVKAGNAAAHGGQTTCTNCGRATVPGQQGSAGVTPPKNETHVDHIIPRSKGGNGSTDNGQVLCRDCNLRKGAD